MPYETTTDPSKPNGDLTFDVKHFKKIWVKKAGGGVARVQLVDVTDDGIADILAGAQDADRTGIVNAGAIPLWRGSPILAGTLDPDVTCAVPGAAAGDRLGR